MIKQLFEQQSNFNDFCKFLWSQIHRGLEHIYEDPFAIIKRARNVSYRVQLQVLSLLSGKLRQFSRSSSQPLQWSNNNEVIGEVAKASTKFEGNWERKGALRH